MPLTDDGERTSETPFIRNLSICECVQSSLSSYWTAFPNGWRAGLLASTDTNWDTISLCTKTHLGEPPHLCLRSCSWDSSCGPVICCTTANVTAVLLCNYSWSRYMFHFYSLVPVPVQLGKHSCDIPFHLQSLGRLYLPLPFTCTSSVSPRKTLLHLAQFLHAELWRLDNQA